MKAKTIQWGTAEHGVQHGRIGNAVLFFCGTLPIGLTPPDPRKPFYLETLLCDCLNRLDGSPIIDPWYSSKEEAFARSQHDLDDWFTRLAQGTLVWETDGWRHWGYLRGSNAPSGLYGNLFCIVPNDPGFSVKRGSYTKEHPFVLKTVRLSPFYPLVQQTSVRTVEDGCVEAEALRQTVINFLIGRDGVPNAELGKTGEQPPTVPVKEE